MKWKSLVVSCQQLKSRPSTTPARRASAKPMPLPTSPTTIVGGGAGCFPLQQPPGAFPVSSYNPALARPLGEDISGNNYSWLLELGAFAGPVDIYMLLQLPQSLGGWQVFREMQPTPQWWL